MGITVVFLVGFCLLTVKIKEDHADSGPRESKGVAV